MKTIALTCSTESDKYFLRLRYIEYCLTAAKHTGVEIMPVILPLTSDLRVIENYAKSFDGYLFTGGDDIDPSLYGEEKHEKCGVIEYERDRFELALLAELINHDRPVLGICRGIQIMNVALGGTLWQDHYTQVRRTAPHAEKKDDGIPKHKVRLSGVLQECIGDNACGWITTNSYHHQAVKAPGTGLTVCAQSEDGIIEGISHETLSFYRAVQWHPEIEPDSISLKLFESFLAHM